MELYSEMWHLLQYTVKNFTYVSSFLEGVGDGVCCLTYCWLHDSGFVFFFSLFFSSSVLLYQQLSFQVLMSCVPYILWNSAMEVTITIITGYHPALWLKVPALWLHACYPYCLLRICPLPFRISDVCWFLQRAYMTVVTCRSSVQNRIPVLCPSEGVSPFVRIRIRHVVQRPAKGLFAHDWHVTVYGIAYVFSCFYAYRGLYISLPVFLQHSWHRFVQNHC